MFLTAALFNQLASEVPGAFETLRTLIVGGEALDPKWVRAVLKEAPPKPRPISRAILAGHAKNTAMGIDSLFINPR